MNDELVYSNVVREHSVIFLSLNLLIVRYLAIFALWKKRLDNS